MLDDCITEQLVLLQDNYPYVNYIEILELLIPLYSVLFSHRNDLAVKFLKTSSFNEVLLQLLHKSMRVGEKDSIIIFDRVLHLIESYILLMKKNVRNLLPFQVIRDTIVIILDDDNGLNNDIQYVTNIFTCILTLYEKDNGNYDIIEKSFSIIQILLNKMVNIQSEQKRTLILKVFETVLSQSNYTNSQNTLVYIHNVLSSLLDQKEKESSIVSLIQLICQSLTSLCQQDDRIKKLLIESEMVPLLLNELNKSFQSITPVTEDNKRIIYSCSKILESSLYKCEDSIKFFHKNNYESFLFSMVNPKLPNRELFQIINKIYIAYCSVVTESIESDILAIFDYANNSDSLQIQCIILNIISSILSHDIHTCDIFRSLNGFTFLLSLLDKMKSHSIIYSDYKDTVEESNIFQTPTNSLSLSITSELNRNGVTDSKNLAMSFNLIQTVLDVLTSAISSNISNKRHIITSQYYKELTNRFEQLGIYTSSYFRYLLHIIQCHIFGISCKLPNVEFTDLQVENAMGIELLFNILISNENEKHNYNDLVECLKNLINNTLHNNNYHNIEAFSKWNIISFIFKHFSNVLINHNNDLYPILYDIIFILSHYHISPSDLFSMLRFMIKTNDVPISQLFYELCQSPNQFPHFYLNHKANNRANIVISKLPKGVLPYQTGLTFSGWYKIDSNKETSENDECNLCLVSFRSTKCEDIMRLTFSEERIIFTVGMQHLPIKTEIIFNSWSHYTIVLSLTHIPNVYDFTLYINASLIVTFQTPPISPVQASNCLIYIGNDSYIDSELQKPINHYNVRIGPCYLYNTKLNEHEISQVYNAGPATLLSSKGVIRDNYVDDSTRNNNHNNNTKILNTPYIFGVLPIQNCINQLVDISGNNCNITLQDNAICISSTDICLPLQSIGGLNLLLPFILQIYKSSDYCVIIKSIKEIIKKNEYYGNYDSFKDGNLLLSFLLLKVVKEQWFDDQAFHDTFSLFILTKGENFTFKSEESLRLFFYNTALLNSTPNNYISKCIKILIDAVSSTNSYCEENISLFVKTSCIEAVIHMILSLTNIPNDILNQLSDILYNLIISNKNNVDYIHSNKVLFQIPSIIIASLLSPDKYKQLTMNNLASNLLYLPKLYQANEKTAQYFLTLLIRIIKEYTSLELYNFSTSTLSLEWFGTLFANCNIPLTCVLCTYLLVEYMQHSNESLITFIDNNIMTKILPYIKPFINIPIIFSILLSLFFNVPLEKTNIYKEINNKNFEYVELPVTDSVIININSNDSNIINIFSCIIILLREYIKQNFVERKDECFKFVDKIIVYIEEFWCYNRTFQSVFYTKPYLHSIISLYFCILNCSNIDPSKIDNLNSNFMIEATSTHLNINDNYFDEEIPILKRLPSFNDYINNKEGEKDENNSENDKLDTSKCETIIHLISTVMEKSITSSFSSKDLINGLFDYCPVWSYPKIINNWYNLLAKELLNCLMKIKNNLFNTSDFSVWCDIMYEYISRGISNYFTIPFDVYSYILQIIFEHQQSKNEEVLADGSVVVVEEEYKIKEQFDILNQCLQLLFYYFITNFTEEKDLLSIIQTGCGHINILIPTEVNGDIYKKLLYRFAGPLYSSIFSLMNNSSEDIKNAILSLFLAINNQNPKLISEFIINLDLEEVDQLDYIDKLSKFTLSASTEFLEWYNKINVHLISIINQKYSSPNLLYDINDSYYISSTLIRNDSGISDNNNNMSLDSETSSPILMSRMSHTSSTQLLLDTENDTVLHMEECNIILMDCHTLVTSIFKDREWKYNSEIRIGKKYFYELLKSISNSKCIWGYDQLGNDIDEEEKKDKIVWKLCTRETKLRMRKRLTRNFKGNSILAELDNNNQNLEVKRPSEPSLFDARLALLNAQALAHAEEDAIDISEIDSEISSQKSAQTPGSITNLNSTINLGQTFSFNENEFNMDEANDDLLLTPLGDGDLEVKRQPSAESLLSSGNNNTSTTATSGGGSSQISDLINSLLLPEDKPFKKIYNCSRVRGMDKFDGICLQCESSLYFIPGFIVNEDGEIKEREFEDDLYHTQSNTTISADNTSSIKITRIEYDEIEIYYKRNYLLKPTAIEFFKLDGTTLFLVYEKIASEELNEFLSTTHKLKNCILRQLRNPKNPKPELLKNYTQQWKDNKLSNFDYLMKLNTLAGRTYNDYTQYPVFPWIIADYTSEELDLKNPLTFRDLSKPMGAQDEDRAEHFLLKFQGLMESKELGPPYHYGFHYSCSGYVLYYLVRLQPFSHVHVDLQGGHFDMPDRLFFSIEESWNSAAHINPQDVRELIPEFYYLPEFLINSNHFKFGHTQDGLDIDNVILPPWCHNDPYEFIRIHRQALECEYVSLHLHEWIDLIFGFKQRGEQAVLAQNVFHPYTYEGAINIEEITDEVLKTSLLSQIREFGQTPSQLFSTPHVKKSILVIKSANNNPNIVRVPFEIEIHGLFKNIDLEVHKKAKIDGNISDLVCIGSNLSPLVNTTGYEMCYIPPKFNRIFIYGFIDGSIREYTTKDSNRSPGKLIALYAGFHTSPITKVCLSKDGKYIVTGSEDGVLIVSTPYVTSKKRELKVLATLSGHHSSILSIAISLNYGVILSGSNDGTAIVWCLYELRFIRSLYGHSKPVNYVDINNLTGDLYTISDNCIRMYSINGVCLSSVDISSLSPCTAFMVLPCVDYYDGIVCITGHHNGNIRLWSIQRPNVESPPIDDPHKSTEIIIYQKVERKATSLVSAVQSTQLFNSFKSAFKSFRVRTFSKNELPPPPSAPLSSSINAASEPLTSHPEDLGEGNVEEAKKEFIPLQRSLMIYSELCVSDNENKTRLQSPITILRIWPQERLIKNLLSVDKEGNIIVWTPK